MVTLILAVVFVVVIVVVIVVVHRNLYPLCRYIDLDFYSFINFFAMLEAYEFLYFFGLKVSWNLY